MAFNQLLMSFCVLVSVFPCSEAAAETVAGKIERFPSERGGPSPRKTDPSFSISANALVNKLRQNQPITIVDIRSPEEFDKTNIPGSINIPLYAIKTKVFLKSDLLVLVEDGFRYTYLERQCETLLENGFKALVLKGGLNGWKQRCGPLQGYDSEHKTFNLISPQFLYQEKNGPQWIMIDASTEQTATSKGQFPNAFHIPFVDSSDNNVLEIGKKIGLNESNRSLFAMVFDEDGNQHEKFEIQMKRAGLTNAFYLRGGLKAYEEFLKHLAMSRKPSNERIRTSRECGSCQKDVSQKVGMQYN